MKATQSMQGHSAEPASMKDMNSLFGLIWSVEIVQDSVICMLVLISSSVSLCVAHVTTFVSEGSLLDVCWAF